MSKKVVMVKNGLKYPFENISFHDIPIPYLYFKQKKVGEFYTSFPVSVESLTIQKQILAILA
jgi:hypothetical protein